MGSREDDHQHYYSTNSSSSSTDSNTNNSNNAYFRHRRRTSNSLCSPSYSSSSFSTNTGNFDDLSSKDLSTDLRLGLSISSQDLSSSPRGQYSDWPPIKTLLRSTLASGKSHCRRETLYVKVYMEGIPIGRKLDLLAHHGYHSLITTLIQMFRTTILSPDIISNNSSDNCHILTYEDKDGDWMMVGDVPWEMFLTTVKRLKIVTYEKCQK